MRNDDTARCRRSAVVAVADRENPDGAESTVSSAFRRRFFVAPGLHGMPMEYPDRRHR
jgi:hypothetical protein